MKSTPEIRQGCALKDIVFTDTTQAIMVTDEVGGRLPPCSQTRGLSPY